MEKLKILGIDEQALKLPNQLSGGQKQRVAIARALINNPHIIMGDEPTGNLDKKNSEIVFEIFQQLAKEFNQTLLIVTHDNEFASRTERIIEMEDGRILNQRHFQDSKE
ncbi:lipoprotein-releasing system ATP-binding protein LolD 1 [Filimonas sp.]|nr:lipoprotein-releasing system ATP-binding protein LolD 1 [Filimonas sp.]